MKIGIISMQRVVNYGSFLQAYGLKSVLEKLGHEVYFIDYKTGMPAVPYSKIKLLRYKLLNCAGIRKIIDWIEYFILKRKLFPYEYRMFYLKELGIGYLKKNYDVDIAIIGSDEVFNCLQDGFNVGFSPMLFGQGLKASKIISYAASFGYTDIEGLKKYGKMNQVRSLLHNFSAISVRDEHSSNIIKDLTGIVPEINLDPVLIADIDPPNIDIPYNNFVILYTYRTRKYLDEERELIKKFCHINKKTLVSIGNFQEWVDICVHASPLELLAYFKAADFIITDTFHGGVISIKYNKKFAVLIREDNKYKLLDLLSRLGQTDRMIKSFQDLQTIFNKPVDYTETNFAINNEKQHTLKYLRENLICDR